MESKPEFSIENSIAQWRVTLKSMSLNLFYMTLLLAFLIVSVVIFLRMKKRRRVGLAN